MRRYTPLFITAFVLLLLFAILSDHLAGYADRTRREKPLQTLTVYTTLPAETADIISSGYERDRKVRLNFLPISSEALIKKVKNGNAADIVLADQPTLEIMAGENMLKPYDSESTDAVAPVFKNTESLWTGIWYDPIVFAVNRDFARGIVRVPNTWQELSYFAGDLRLGITDFLAADAAKNLFFSMMSQYGDEVTYQLLFRLHPKVVQYAKYLSTPVRMAGMGETDLSIAVESETLRYIAQGYPLQIVYPEDGTAYTLTGVGILRETAHKQDAEAFVEWLLSDEAQLALQKKLFFFVPVNPLTNAYKSFAGKNIVLYGKPQEFSPEVRHQLLDRWVKEVRLGSVE
ncbi:ABC transporter substrate-binding protein [Selenomonas sp. TAMA-11512]|uniref:ABC transporter substrate-binding protein n=1 Tax=Selenomonas sp. TAMA-11512 TaxID=3095337 RepID=UPI003090D147|nr:ABC transporter substrate-binding protein [Selenomonas sp. TAMA-11512]